MPDNPIIYAVSSGEYSDYSIKSMFSTKENAQAYIDTQKEEGNHDDYDIEEWELDREVGFIFRPRWTASIRLQDGKIVFEWCSRLLASPHARTDEPSLGGNFGVAAVFSYVSQEHALKLAAEYRQQWLREQDVINAAKYAEAGIPYKPMAKEE